MSPATGTPVVGGLTYREGIYITEQICQTGKAVFFAGHVLTVKHGNPNLPSTIDRLQNRKRECGSQSRVNIGK